MTPEELNFGLSEDLIDLDQIYGRIEDVASELALGSKRTLPALDYLGGMDDFHCDRVEEVDVATLESEEDYFNYIYLLAVISGARSIRKRILEQSIAGEIDSEEEIRRLDQDGNGDDDLEDLDDFFGAF